MAMIKRLIQNLVAEHTGMKPEDVAVEKPKSDFGDYATNIAFLLKISAGELAKKINKNLPSEIERVEASGGYVNFFLSTNFLRQQLEKMMNDSWRVMHDLEGQTVMVEYTDPNPFKQFHIGHLMSNAIGESIARLYEASGAKVLRVNYQGDVGLHVAKAVWANCDYAVGAKAYETDENAKKEIEKINQKIYDRSDIEINKLYDGGRKGSLDHFETIYRRLGTKFDHYFFESEMGRKGLEIVRAHSDIFEESDGAVVFRGENYGLHTRVFINAQGLPTYEAKELGLAEAKWSQFRPDASIVVTGNEINEYYKVLLRVMELLDMELAGRTKHLGHGMLRLPTGKMSSRTGDVITAEALINQVKENVGSEEIAIGAIKYSILKQGIGRDVVFDFDKSISIRGDSGVYLQYTYARLQSILAKANPSVPPPGGGQVGSLNEKSELAIIKHLMEFPDAIREARERLAPNCLALYLYELANGINAFYEKVQVLTAEVSVKAARLALVQTAASILSRGLWILGIKAPQKI